MYLYIFLTLNMLFCTFLNEIMSNVHFRQGDFAFLHFPQVEYRQSIIQFKMETGVHRLSRWCSAASALA